MVLEIGIMLWHCYWIYHNRRTLKEARRAGMTYDQYVGDDMNPPKTPSSSYNPDSSRNNSLTPHTTLDQTTKTHSEKTDADTSDHLGNEKDAESNV